MTARTNDEWLRDLRGGGEVQEAALVDLRAHLVRAARFALHRRARSGGLAPTTINALAEDCAQDALVAILARLDGFRGDSRFTTWAYAFAVNMALVAARREAWRHVSLESRLDVGADALVADPAVRDPDQSARRVEAWRVVREVIERDLTARQRSALQALVVDEVPLDELARHWGSNRNALYKLLHDARRRMKAALERRGFTPPEILALFGPPR